MRNEKLATRLPEPVPVQLGEQRGELLLDLDGLFQVYSIQYVATPPKQVEKYLQRSGKPALVIFKKDGETNQASLVEEQSTIKTTVEHDWISKLLETLAGKEDPLEAVEWVRAALEALKEQQDSQKKRPYRNQGLFSDHYLENRLRESEEWKGDYEDVRNELLKLWESKKSILSGANEAQTEEELIQPILEKLNFAYWVQASTKATGSTLRPDYVLYPDNGSKEKALKNKQNEKGLYAPALAIAEAKYYGRDLDVKKRDAKDRVHGSVSPSFQLSEYLSATGKEWGILTNGLEWRLYWGRATDKQKRYFAVNLERALQDPEAFRFFWLFFRRDAFQEGAQGSFLGRILEGSEKYGMRVGTQLKQVVFEQVFPLMAEGFLKYHQDVLRKTVNDETLQQTYRATLTLLYRLLFLLYAEDRDLLPVSDTLGYQQYSLSRIRREVASQIDNGQSFSTKAHKLWESLTALFKTIDEGDRDLKVPPYNGGLFKPGTNSFLETHKLADAYLAPALDKLARQKDEDGQQRFVDYKYLTVRELGAVYEGLLEFSLKVADEDLAVVREKGREVYKPKSALGKKEKPVAEVSRGKPFLVNDQKERHATGSYYTPDYIVEYIVNRTLEEVVGQRRAVLEKVLQDYNHLSKLHENSPDKETADKLNELRSKALEDLLDVKVVDPAMGSGHFLVGAVDFLSERFANLITELQAEPVVDALGELRAEIKNQMQQFGLELRDEQLSDINLLKRMVMKRCVFGVDLNPMAVELAKLSLWLDAFTVGAPLSFLDHHLRHGNSVLGLSRKEFERWVDQENPMWLDEIKREVEEATGKARELLNVRDLTPKEVERSQTLYKEAEAALTPLRHALDIFAAGLFAEKPQKGKSQDKKLIARTHLPTVNLPTLADPPAKYHLAEAIAFARERHFFHWEFEFPEVFFSPNRKHNPGFDAVIGNPPYVRQEQLGPNKLFFQKAYPKVYAGATDLYAYFFAKGLGVLRKRGRLGFISSRQFTRAEYGRGLRSLLTRHAIKEVTDFGENPVFEGVGTFPAVFVVEHNQPIYPIRFKAVSKAEFAQLLKAPAEARSETLAQLVEGAHELNQEAFQPEGWTFGSIDENTILHKMKENGVTLGNYVKGKIYWGIKTGLNEAFYIDEATQHQLITKDPNSEKIIKPLLVGDDVRHYYARWPKRYIILIPSSSDFNNPDLEASTGIPRHTWADKNDEAVAEEVFKKTYPAIYEHLLPFKKELKARDDQGRWWWELRPCAYYHLLEAPKIVYPEIAKESRFYLDTNGYYINNKLFFIPVSDPFLLAVLNSKIAFNAMKLILSSLGDAEEGGRLELRAVHLKHLPIPRTDENNEGYIIYKEDYKNLFSKIAENKTALTWAETELAEGRKNAVAALLAHLAQEMQLMQAKRLKLEEAWRDWVKHTFSGTEKLGKEWLQEDWARDGLAKGIDAITERFKAKKVQTSPKSLSELKEHTQEVLDQIRPLYQRIQETDELIDRLVARLYGLTDEEAARLWASPLS